MHALQSGHGNSCSRLSLILPAMTTHRRNIDRGQQQMKKSTSLGRHPARRQNELVKAVEIVDPGFKNTDLGTPFRWQARPGRQAMIAHPVAVDGEGELEVLYQNNIY
jgi:hypothetical protein